MPDSCELVCYRCRLCPAVRGEGVEARATKSARHHIAIVLRTKQHGATLIIMASTPNQMDIIASTKYIR